MSGNTGKLSQARSFRGTVRGMITCLEAPISKLEDKPEITASDYVRIQAHTERIISLDTDFKTHHFHVIELVDEDDEDTLKQEQAILDDHEDRMNEIMDHLTQLSHSKSSPTIVAPSMGLETKAEPSRLLRRRLNHMESTLRSINSTIETLTSGPGLDACLVQHIEKQISRISAEDSDLTRDILALEHEDHDLLDLSSTLAKTLFNVSLQIERLLSDQAAPPSTNVAKIGIKLPKRNVPTFDGNILNCNTF